MSARRPDPPFTPMELQDAVSTRRRGASLTNAERVARAIEDLRHVSVSLAGKAPAGWRPAEADVHRINIEHALASLAPVHARFGR